MTSTGTRAPTSPTKTEPTANLREGLQEASVAALQERADLLRRRQNYRAPRRAAGRHRLLNVGVLGHIYVYMYI